VQWKEEATSAEDVKEAGSGHERAVAQMAAARVPEGSVGQLGESDVSY